MSIPGYLTPVTIQRRLPEVQIATQQNLGGSVGAALTHDSMPYAEALHIEPEQAKCPTWDR